jgi:hypothetical protein
MKNAFGLTIAAFGLAFFNVSTVVVEAQFNYTITNGMVTITGYTGPPGDVLIPDRINNLAVTDIGPMAFNYDSGLTSVTIPNSVTSIGVCAFADCTSLRSVTIGSSVTNIGVNAFYYDTGLTSVTIPNSVTNIGDSAFASCFRLTSVTIGNSVTSIGDDAFGDTGLTSVTIPSSVASIGQYAFAHCTNLTAITADTLNPVYSSVDGVLFDKSQTTLVQCPCGKAGAYIVPNSVTSVGTNAFFECYTLTSVTFPNSVTNIEDAAFSFCSSLTNVTIPDSITSIGNGAFSSSGLVSVTIPDSVTNIGRAAFYYDSGLTSVTIPNSVASIGDWAFAGCSLTNATIGTNVATISDYAFGYTSLTSITIPNSVTSVGQAFVGCGSLTNITFGSGVTNISQLAFNFCTSLTAIKVDALNSSYSSLNGVLFDKDQTTLVAYPEGKGESYTIPNTVTNIGDYAFRGCTSVTGVTIPNSVASIGFCAFAGCTNLTTLTIPNSVTDIKDGFMSLNARTTGAFSGCSSLTNVMIGNSVSNIGSWAFSGKPARPLPIRSGPLLAPTASAVARAISAIPYGKNIQVVSTASAGREASFNQSKGKQIYERVFEKTKRQFEDQCSKLSVRCSPRFAAVPRCRRGQFRPTRHYQPAQGSLPASREERFIFSSGDWRRAVYLPVAV